MISTMAMPGMQGMQGMQGMPAQMGMGGMGNNMNMGMGMPYDPMMQFGMGNM